jgi:hypothetical protein
MLGCLTLGYCSNYPPTPRCPLPPRPPRFILLSSICVNLRHLRLENPYLTHAITEKNSSHRLHRVHRSEKRPSIELDQASASLRDLRCSAVKKSSLRARVPSVGPEARPAAGYNTTMEVAFPGTRFLGHLADPAPVSQFFGYALPTNFVSELQNDLIGSHNTFVRHRFRNAPEILAEWRIVARIHRTTRGHPCLNLHFFSLRRSTFIVPGRSTRPKSDSVGQLFSAITTRRSLFFQKHSCTTDCRLLKRSANHGD